MVSGVSNAGVVERVEVVVGLLKVTGTPVAVVVVVVVGLIVEVNFPSSGGEILAEVMSHNKAVKEEGGDVVLEIAGPMELHVDLGELVVSAVAPTPVLKDADVTLTVVCGATISDETEGACGAEGDVLTLIGRSGDGEAEVVGGGRIGMPVVEVIDDAACIVCEAEVGRVVGQ